MHEVEIGTWKAVFIQLVRLLEAVEKGRMNELDARYRRTPTFGRDTIRRFINNVSEMKQLAARDLKDLLQCAIPAFEGLLPSPHNERVTKYLFTFACWHGFANLRLHTDHTLRMLDDYTTQLGEETRAFVVKTCGKFKTKELAREYQARKRREARKKQDTASKTAPPDPPEDVQAPATAATATELPVAPPPAMESIDTTAEAGPSEERPSTINEIPLTDGRPANQEEDAINVPEDVNIGTKRRIESELPMRASKRLKSSAKPAQEDTVSLTQDPRPAREGLSTKRRKKWGGMAPSERTQGASSSTTVDLPEPVQIPKHTLRPRKLDAGPSVTSKRKLKGKSAVQSPRSTHKHQSDTRTTSEDKTLDNQVTATQGITADPGEGNSGETEGGSASNNGVDEPGAKARAPKRWKIAEQPTQNTGSAADMGENNDEGEEKADGRKGKTLNLHTYKWHAMGDVVPTIRLFVTTDSYSTQLPERFHRYPKMHYKRTSKRKVPRQLSHIQAWQAHIRKLCKQLVPDRSEDYNDTTGQHLPYFIGKSENHPVKLPAFIRMKQNDPAVKEFLPKLRAHLLPRIYRQLLEEEEASEDKDEQRISLLKSLLLDNGCSTDRDVSMNEDRTTALSDDADRIYVLSDRLYQHNIFHINYTSYDVRRETDIINPKTSRRDVMCLRALDQAEVQEAASGSAHRFMYARVLGVYHVNVLYRGRGATDLRRCWFDLLWVRWYTFCEDEHRTDLLDRLQLGPVADVKTINFLYPADVLRACHIIPRYSKGQLYGTGEKDRIESKLAKDQEDWRKYYVNRFVDRDMLMQYAWGHGVGHTYSHLDAPNSSSAASGSTESGNGGTSPQAPEVRLKLVEEELHHGEPFTAIDNTLEDLEAEELALVDPAEEDEESDFGGEPIQDPDTEAED